MPGERPFELEYQDHHSNAADARFIARFIAVVTALICPLINLPELLLGARILKGKEFGDSGIWYEIMAIPGLLVFPAVGAIMLGWLLWRRVWITPLVVALVSVALPFVGILADEVLGGYGDEDTAFTIAMVIAPIALSLLFVMPAFRRSINAAI